MGRKGVPAPWCLFSTRKIPTSDCWAPAIFVKQEFGKDPTHETAADQEVVSWQGPGSRGAFERARYDDSTPDQYEAGAYVLGTVYRYLEALEASKDHSVRFMIRVCFWGDDDTGMERDTYYATPEQAEEAYFAAIGWMSRLAVVSRAGLSSIGFKGA